MSQTMTLEIPEQRYQKLAELAKRRGKSPAVVILETIEQITDDPFEKWIGALPTGVQDWPGRHDELLGLEALNPHDSDSEQHPQP